MTRHEFDTYVELYRRGVYSEIPIGAYAGGDYFYMTPKQIRTMELLNDDSTTFIGYGGSARSGKTIIECTAIIMDCFAYPGIAWGLCRKELTVLKRTVLLTLFKQLEFFGFIEENYVYNQQLNRIIFEQGSEIFLIDTAHKPSDPLNTRFGSFELTKCAVDESNETNPRVVAKLFERTGWRLNDRYNLKRKMFECFNPDKNHVYSRYYKPYRDKTQPSYKRFIPALPADNPNPTVSEWIKDMIQTGDQSTIQRQVYGNFDYDDDPTRLCDFDAICDSFTNTHVAEGSTAISADLAMQGRDRFVAGSWSGLRCRVDIDKKKATGREIELDLKALKVKRRVGNTRIVADSDGLGAYIESYIRNLKEFHGGSRAVNRKMFGNIKDECGFKLAEMINKRDLLIICDPDQEEAIKNELSTCLKRDNVNNDKKRLIKKGKMKEFLGGGSPDYMDMLIMGMFFEVASRVFKAKKR